MRAPTEKAKKPKSWKRRLGIILGSAILLGGIYYAIHKSGEQEAPFLQRPAHVGKVEKKSDLEHQIIGHTSINFRNSTAILFPDPPQILLFRQGAQLTGMVLDGVKELRNPQMKVQGDSIVVCADDFFGYVKGDLVFRVNISELGTVGKKNPGCSFYHGSYVFVGSDRSDILVQATSGERYGFSASRIFEIESMIGFIKPSLASAAGHVFLISEGMKRIYRLGFKPEEMSLEYRQLKEAIGLEQAKNMRLLSADGKLYLIDDAKKILYKLDPEKMKMIEKSFVK